MRVRTKVNILSGAVALFFLFLFLSAFLLTGLYREAGWRIAMVGFFGLAVIILLFFWEFRIPKEKYALKGKATDVKLPESPIARIMVFNLNSSPVVFGSPTPLFSPPEILDKEVEAYGDVIKVDKLPSLIFWNTKSYLKSVAYDVFFATRIKNLSTGEEYEAPLFVPALQIILWALIILAPFAFLPESVFDRIREIIYVGIQWLLVPVFGIIGFILAIILPNWIIKRRKQQK